MAMISRGMESFTQGGKFGFCAFLSQPAHSPPAPEGHPLHRNWPACLPSGVWSSQVHYIPMEPRNICSRGSGKGASLVWWTAQSVCISWGCHNQGPQTRCFKQQKFMLSAVEAGSPKSRCQQGHTASETHSAILPCFSPLSGDSLAWRHVSPISASVLMWPSSYKDASHMGLACVCAKLLQLCLTLCHPMDYSLPGSSVRGIFQARVLELVAFSF